MSDLVSPEVVKNSPERIPSAKEQKVNRSLQIRQEVRFESPLPPAEFIKTYSVISPEAPKQLLDVFMKQVNHRMSMERSDLAARIWLRVFGQATGFLLVLAMLGVGVYALKLGALKTACAIFMTTIPFCAIVFVLGRQPRRDVEGTSQEDHKK